MAMGGSPPPLVWRPGTPARTGSPSGLCDVRPQGAQRLTQAVVPVGKADNALFASVNRLWRLLAAAVKHSDDHRHAWIEISMSGFVFSMVPHTERIAAFTASEKP